MRQISYHQPITTFESTPTFPSHDHNWYCSLDKSHLPNRPSASRALHSGACFTSGTLWISSNTTTSYPTHILNVSITYHIRLFVSDNGSFGSADQEISVLQGPRMTLECLKNCDYYIRPTLPMVLRVVCSECLATEWALGTGFDAYYDLESCDDQYKCSLTDAQYKLIADNMYSAVILIGTDKFDHRMFVSSPVRVIQPPTFLSCIVTPGVGVAHVTRFSIVCDVITEVIIADSSTISYKFYVFTEDGHGRILSAGMSPFLRNFTLTAPIAGNNRVEISVEKCNLTYACITQSLSVVVNPSPDSNWTCDEDDDIIRRLVREIEISIASGDYRKMSEIVASATSEQLICSGKIEDIMMFTCDTPLVAIDTVDHVIGIITHLPAVNSTTEGNAGKDNVTSYINGSATTQCSVLSYCNTTVFRKLVKVEKFLVDQRSEVTISDAKLIVTSSINAVLKFMSDSGDQSHQICWDHLIHKFGNLLSYWQCPDDPEMNVDVGAVDSSIAVFGNSEVLQTSKLELRINESSLFTNTSRQQDLILQTQTYNASVIDFNLPANLTKHVHSIALITKDDETEHVPHNLTSNISATFPVFLCRECNSYTLKLNNQTCDGRRSCQTFAEDNIVFERTIESKFLDVQILVRNRNNSIMSLNITLTYFENNATRKISVGYKIQHTSYLWTIPKGALPKEATAYNATFRSMFSTNGSSETEVYIYAVNCVHWSSVDEYWDDTGCTHSVRNESPHCECDNFPTNLITCHDDDLPRSKLYATYFSMFPVWRPRPVNATEDDDHDDDGNIEEGDHDDDGNIEEDDHYDDSNSTAFDSQYLFEPSAQNSIPVAVMITLHATYLIWVIWIVGKERKEAMKGEYIELDDQSQGYGYYVTFYMSSRFCENWKPGNVTLDIRGDNFYSHSHLIQNRAKKSFSRKEVKSFLVKTRAHLGEVKSLQLFHDSQEHGEKFCTWFFERIVVEDLNENMCWFFLRQEENDTLDRLTLYPESFKRLSEFSRVFWLRLKRLTHDRNLLYALMPLTQRRHLAITSLQRLALFYQNLFGLGLTTLSFHGRTVAQGVETVDPVFAIHKGALSSLLLLPISFVLFEIFHSSGLDGQNDEVSYKKKTNQSLVKSSLLSTNNYQQVSGGSKAHLRKAWTRRFSDLYDDEKDFIVEKPFKGRNTIEIQSDDISNKKKTDPYVVKSSLLSTTNCERVSGVSKVDLPKPLTKRLSDLSVIQEVDEKSFTVKSPFKRRKSIEIKYGRTGNFEAILNRRDSILGNLEMKTRQKVQIPLQDPKPSTSDRLQRLNSVSHFVQPKKNKATIVRVSTMSVRPADANRAIPHVSKRASGWSSVGPGKSQQQPNAIGTLSKSEADESRCEAPTGQEIDPRTVSSPLPHYFRIFAWFFILVSILACTAVCVWLGLSYGRHVCRQWLITFTTAVVVSIFVVEPVKVVVHTIISLSLKPTFDLKDWLPSLPKQLRLHGGKVEL